VGDSRSERPVAARLFLAAEGTASQILKSGMHETAIAVLQANVEEHPKSALAHFGLGRAYRSAGRETDAIASFKAAIAIDPLVARLF
jgi:cytochrome c-type biogenesis protein CcmH/NrfG